ncbi:DUF2231 domain-containing protein [Rouxiella badensis]|uniref:DUF2231 domain-containing protein n=1 Tax=Rouxiella badensis TaxID=1646377 RepID=A0A1X0WGR3_9GAMM|nr:DUF2231 domain-containing protein [Rouxiella badensis]MCC3731509.1 hypothetical protein [Rouxiella badensis]MCC3756898.1 hypothetical protein [Rouxiella badensis]ORJ25997.1 hypothetical protein BS640_07765 [Rouxiella badensis]WAT03870.1 hypothetical protein O1V64_16360 [Rouxiella badensis]WAT10378.1 hypothetical protein O1V65_07415 [Rouxiella badensis]
MTSLITPQNSALAAGFVSLLDPLPIGFFTAAWIFDIIYIYSSEIAWTQAASWLIVFGLLIAIIPRLINLVQVWVGTSYPQSSAVKLHFWASALAIILSIFNAFIHSRDAFAVVPAGVTLSSLVVLLLLIANLQLALRQRKAYGEAK